MKEILGMIGGAFVLVVIMSYSYSTTESKGIMNPTAIVPLKQKGVFVTTDYAKVNKLIKKGWVMEDVDMTGESYNRDIQAHYTLIKY
jgi:hypothetical protein